MIELTKHSEGRYRLVIDGKRSMVLTEQELIGLRDTIAPVLRESIESDLKSYAQDWAVFVAEDGEEKTKADFKVLVERAKMLKMDVVSVYPDGTSI